MLSSAKWSGIIRKVTARAAEPPGTLSRKNVEPLQEMWPAKLLPRGNTLLFHYCHQGWTAIVHLWCILLTVQPKVCTAPVCGESKAKWLLSINTTDDTFGKWECQTLHTAKCIHPDKKLLNSGRKMASISLAFPHISPLCKGHWSPHLWYNFNSLKTQFIHIYKCLYVYK